MLFLLRYGFLMLLLLLSHPLTARALPSWERAAEQPAGPGTITALAPNLTEPGKLLAASTHEILENTKKGTWKSLGRPGNGNAGVLGLEMFPSLPGKLFVLTENGAYLGDLRAKHWTEAFPKKRSSPIRVSSFSVLPEDPDYWLAGTDSGLFESDDKGATWHRFESFPDREAIRKIHFEKNRFWIVTQSRIYMTDTLTSFRVIFSLRAQETRSPDENLPQNMEDIASSSPEILTAAFSDTSPLRIWLGTSDGVFEYDSEKNDTRHLSSSGLKNHAVRYLAWAPKNQTLAAGTSSGIFLFDNEHGLWNELYRGLSSQDVQSLSVVSEKTEKLAAVTLDGVVTFPLGADLQAVPRGELPSLKTAELFQFMLRVEPSARDIQQAVIKAANASPKKIRRWHRQSRLQAFFPNVSFGRDFSRGNSVDIDRGGTNDPDRYIAGPDQIDRGWDLGVSWDLGDFIWSSNQTSIDSRDKLMTELRNDLVAEATRLYFERRRLQMELAYAAPQDEQTFYDKRFRLDELTALLDALTGGYLSLALDENRRDYPQLEILETPPVQE